MKPNTKLQKIISILMPFILMVEITGCYSTRKLSTNEITKSDYYMIHSKVSNFLTYNDTISDGMLSGKLDFNIKDFNDPRYTHIYLSSDSMLTINNDQISFPVNSIKEIKQKVPDQKKTRTLMTVLIVAGCVGVVTVVSAIIIANSITRAADQTAKGCSNIINSDPNSSTGLCSNW